MVMIFILKIQSHYINQFKEDLSHDLLGLYFNATSYNKDEHFVPRINNETVLDMSDNLTSPCCNTGL